ARDPEPERWQWVSRQSGDIRFRRVAQDQRLLAGRQLPVRRADLSLRQPAAARTSDAGPCQAAGGRTLGHDAGGLSRSLRSIYIVVPRLAAYVGSSVWRPFRGLSRLMMSQ